MPPNAKHVQQEDILQAVVLADAFDDRLFPYISDVPLALMQVATNTLIDQCLRYLRQHGVRRCFVCSCRQTAKLRRHLVRGGWLGLSEDAGQDGCMSVTLVCVGGGGDSSDGEQSQEDDSQLSRDNCDAAGLAEVSVGDVLRELDARAVLQAGADFLLLSAGCVTNWDFSAALRQHTARRTSTDRGLVVTLACRATLPRHAARLGRRQCVLAADGATSRVLFHRHVPPPAPRPTSLTPTDCLHIPLAVFDNCDAVEVRHDLVDATGLWLCAPCLPQIFADNFDYQTMDQLVRGVINNEDITGNTVYYHCIDQEYLCCVDSLHSLENVTWDVLNRRVFPLTPPQPCYSNVRSVSSNVYRHPSAQLASDVQLLNDVCLDADVIVGGACQLSSCVIGCGSRLDSHCCVKRSLIGSACQLGRGVRVLRSLIGCRVRLDDDVTVEEGCVLGDHVYVQSGHFVPAGSRLTAVGGETSFSSRSANVAGEPAVDIVGNGGVGYLVRSCCEVGGAGSEDDEVDDLGRVTPVSVSWPAPVTGLLEPSVDSCSSESDESDVTDDVIDDALDEEDEVDAPSHRKSPAIDTGDVKQFYSEVVESFVRGFEERVSSENLILEVNSSKFAYNITSDELNGLVVKAVLSVGVPEDTGKSAAQLWSSSLAPVLVFFTPVLANYLKNDSAMMQALNAVETCCRSQPPMLACAVKLLQFFYERDLLSEECILAWYHNSPLEDATAHSAIVRKQIERLVQWLQEAEEESD